MVGVPGKVYPELAEGNPGFQIEKMLQGKEGHYIYMIRLSSFLLLLFPVLTTNVPRLFPMQGRKSFSRRPPSSVFSKLALFLVLLLVEFHMVQASIYQLRQNYILSIRYQRIIRSLK